MIPKPYTVPQVYENLRLFATSSDLNHVRAVSQDILNRGIANHDLLAAAKLAVSQMEEAGFGYAETELREAIQKAEGKP